MMKAAAHCRLGTKSLAGRVLSTEAGQQTSDAITILDGGMGHALRRLGVEISGPIGSQRRFLGVALANVEKPELVQRAHRDYLAAGATVLTTNNYAVVPATLALAAEAGDFSDADLERLLIAACDAATAAIDAHTSTTVEGNGASVDQNAAATGAGAPGPEPEPAPRPLVAGALPPLRESYAHDQVPTNADELAQLVRSYKRIAETLAPRVDVLLAETMSCAREAAAALEGARQALEGLGMTVGGERADAAPQLWVSWTLAEAADGTLRSGEPIEEALAALATSDATVVGGGDGGGDGDGTHTSGARVCVDALLLNCSSVESVSAAMPRLHAALDARGQRGAATSVGAERSLVPYEYVRIGGYANAFVTAHSDGTGSDYDEALSPTAYARAVTEQWLPAGADIVGGCCGIFPEHIEELHRSCKAPGGNVV